MTNPKADQTVEIVSSRADYKVQVVGDQVVDLTGATPGDVLVVQPDGSLAPAPSSSVGGTAPVSSVNTRTGAVTGLAEQTALTTEVSRATAAEAAKADATTAVGGGVARVSEGFLSWLDPRVGGVLDNGVSEQSAAMSAALALLGVSGGVLFIPPGRVRIDGQITPPNDGGATPKQKSIRIFGAGCSFDGNGQVPNGGTIIDLGYNGAGVAKIDTRGLGTLEIDHLTLRDLSGSSKPFIQTTNTTLMVHDVEFYGSKNGTANDQDCIVLGGTSITIDGSSNAAFQGYGTVVERCYFNHVRRCVYGRTYCNGVVVRDNTIWQSAGAAAGIGAIEFVGVSTNTCTGNLITGNLIETVAYTWGVYLNDYCTGNTVAFNNFFDPTGTTAYIRCNATATATLVIAGYSSDTHPTLDDQSASANLITAHSNQQSVWKQPVKFDGLTTFSTTATFTATTGITVQPAATQTESSIRFRMLRSAAEATAPGAMVFQINQAGVTQIGGTLSGIYLYQQDGTTLKTTIDQAGHINSSTGGSMRIHCGSGGSYLTLQSYGVIFMDYLGVKNATLKVGTGSPEGAYAAAVGSIWLRTDGGTSTALYVKETGAATSTGWVAK